MGTNKQNDGEEKNQDLLVGFYSGKEVFCKVYLAMDIEKIKFSFVDNKAKTSIDYYMGIDYFEFDFLDRIQSGSFLEWAAKARQNQKKENAKYASAIWTSLKSKKTIKENGTAKEILKDFSIAPGNSSDFVFTASESGKRIIVGVDYREMKHLYYIWHNGKLHEEWLEIMRGKYNRKAMTPSYNRDTTEKESSKPASNSVNSFPKNEADITVKFTSELANMNNGGKAVKAITVDDKELFVIYSPNVVKTKSAEISNISDGKTMKIHGYETTDQAGKIRFFVS